MLLKGKAVTEKLESDILHRVSELEKKSVKPTLGIVRVGENPSDIAYEKSAVKKAEKLGIIVKHYIADSDVTQDELLKIIESINEDKNVHGVLLFRPLPKHIDENLIRNSLAVSKDLDGISDLALAGVFTGTEQGFPPCTAAACIEILKHYNCELKGKKAVVIGRSMVIGKPVAMMLMKENATVTVTHTKTSLEDLRNYCRKADIIVASAGHINTLKADMVTSGQTIIDVGINFNEEGKMVGDVDFGPVSEVVDSITPVPGGVGGVTTTLLMRNLVNAAEKSL